MKPINPQDKRVASRHENLIKENLHRFKYLPDTGQLVWADSPKKRLIGKLAGSFQKDGYVRVNIKVNGKQTLVLAHHIVWLMHNETLPDIIDHINRDGADNRIKNLREANPLMNSQNQSMFNTNTSGFVGVSYFRQSGKWKAEIRSNNIHKYLGLFDTPEDAGEAYMRAKKELHINEHTRI